MMASYVGPNDDVLISVRSGEGDVCLSKVPSILTVEADYKDSLPARFGRYWTRKKLSDMVIMCRGQIFEVHRVTLSGFSTLFESAISNQLENDILILDYDPVSMNICLEYLYMGRTEVDRDHAKAVASLAKILDIPHLYNTCRAAELKDATAGADNCLDMWSFGETVGDGELLRRGKNAALVNVDDLMEQESFMNLSYSHPKLVSH